MLGDQDHWFAAAAIAFAATPGFGLSVVAWIMWLDLRAKKEPPPGLVVFVYCFLIVAVMTLLAPLLLLILATL
ncbi:hypothetical protein [Stratiformator vulcanicus]|uniref:Uncharacterized protein n=1 Tax=Stratiformator vulcanicus TaxID=2527980 RepID=A0A517R496_9PLAN|nr:hypothetical protein [Stratiformator vulcanicus]QDT38687.1 hypothetical protein Pan189_30830 [Stratiformator vulcanicus]